MEIPKLVYDDFYKFLVSFGAILFVMGVIGIFLRGTSWPLVILSVCGIGIMIWAGKKWYRNQKLLDEKLENEVKLIKNQASRIIESGIVSTGSTDESARIPKRVRKTADHRISGESNTAIVSYQIASVLPNSVPFDFLKDGRVWFWISNHEKKKYLAYIKIGFFVDGNFFKEVDDGYYGGTKAWNLNALTGIQAPGLGIPEEIKDAAKQGRRIKIQIDCSIHDESGGLVEKKLPQAYIYDPENNSWFLEP